jgi:hypothetical protein
VQQTQKDPVPGFIDKIIGPAGLGVGMLAGLIRVIKTSTKVYTDLVPADVVVNSTLAIARQVSMKSESDHLCDPIFHSTINKCRVSTISTS